MNRRLKRRWCLIAALALWGGVCSAQDAPQIEAGPTYATCLTPPAAQRGSPEYPEWELASKVTGLIRVSLTFTGKDSAPSVKYLNPSVWNEDANAAFLKSVERFVANYRLPCLTEGAATMVQEFSFVPDSRKVLALGVSDAPSEEAANDCRIEYVGNKPVYPSGSQRPYGNVVLRMTFSQRDEAPRVTVVYGAGHYLLADTAKAWANNYRLRCAKPIETQVFATQTYRFMLEGGPNATLKDMGFVAFLQSADRSSLGKPKFDFNSMSCPFDVKVTLLQPHAPNRVAEVEQRYASRSEFLKWLTTVVFNYPKGYERLLVGESTTVSVPCMALDLS